MALHGEIKVNDVVIGAWSAVRKAQVSGQKRVWYYYDCEVVDRDLQGYPRNAKFTIVHAFDEGALVLAGKVLTEAGRPGTMKRIEHEDS